MKHGVGFGVAVLLLGLVGSRAPARAQTVDFQAPAELPPAPPAPPATLPVEAVPAPPAAAAPPVPAPVANPLPPPLPAALAPTEPKFGEERELMFSGQLSASLGHLGYSNSGASTTGFSVAPAADYFLSRNLFVGAAAFLSYSDTASGLPVEVETLRYGVYGHLGWNAWLSEKLSLLPTLSLGEWHEQSSYSAPRDGFTASVGGTAVNVGSDVTQTVVIVEVFSPLLFHPARHFFIGVGPDVYVDVLHEVANQAGGTASNPRTFIGLSSIVGGWLDPRAR